MPGGTIRAKGDDHMWPHPAQMGYDAGNDLARVSEVQIAVDILQEIDPPQAEDAGCLPELAFAYAAERRRTGVGVGSSGPAQLAACRRQQVGRDTFSRIFSKHAAHAK
jgi:hypothetical protein